MAYGRDDGYESCLSVIFFPVTLLRMLPWWAWCLFWTGLAIANVIRWLN